RRTHPSLSLGRPDAPSGGGLEVTLAQEGRAAREQLKENRLDQWRSAGPWPGVADTVRRNCWQVDPPRIRGTESCNRAQKSEEPREKQGGRLDPWRVSLLAPGRLHAGNLPPRLAGNGQTVRATIAPTRSPGQGHHGAPSAFSKDYDSSSTARRGF